MDKNRETLKQYADLKSQVSKLEDQMEALKPEVMDIIESVNPDDKTVETDFGSFTVVQKRKYEYSDEIVALEKDVKERKKAEEATGDAVYTIAPYLKFTSSNID